MHDKRIEQALMVILTTKYFNMDKIIRKLLMYKVSKAIWYVVVGVLHSIFPINMCD